MGILDGIVEWIAEQVMNGLDLVTSSVLGALVPDIRSSGHRHHPVELDMAVVQELWPGSRH